MFGTNHKGIGVIIAVVLALAFMAMPVAQVNAQSTGITGAVENVGSALGGMVEGLTNTLSSDFIMSIVESISMRIGRVFGAGLFVASTDNIFFRALEWIVGFLMMILLQVVYEILGLIYFIPCVSMAGAITQIVIWPLVIYPLSMGLPEVFASNIEGGFNWLNTGSSVIFTCFNTVWGTLYGVIMWIAHIIYGIGVLIPCVNILAAFLNVVLAFIFFILVDVVTLIFSAYMLIQGACSSVITDCVIISRAMCRACLGV
jgi:hypothetical protein